MRQRRPVTLNQPANQYLVDTQTLEVNHDTLNIRKGTMSQTPSDTHLNEASQEHFDTRKNLA